MSQTLLNPELMNKYQVLLDRLRNLKSVLVAFSGGVDSGVMSMAAFEALGDSAIAVNIMSEVTPSAEATIANDVAKFIGIKYQQIYLPALDDVEVVANTKDRCYFCKSHDIEHLQQIAKTNGYDWVVDGTNLDDLDDYRPGLKATEELNVKHPFIDAKLVKTEIRQIAHWKELPNADWPSMACLASRIAYNIKLDAAVLKQVDDAENYLRSLGYKNVRVRYHGDVVRIELESDELKAFISTEHYLSAQMELKAIGFKHVTLDLAGYRMGSMNI